METRRFEQKKTILAGLVLFLGIVFLGLTGDLFPGWAAKQTRDKALLNDLTVKAPAHEIMAALEAGLAASRAREDGLGSGGWDGSERQDGPDGQDG